MAPFGFRGRQAQVQESGFIVEPDLVELVKAASTRQQGKIIGRILFEDPQSPLAEIVVSAEERQDRLLVYHAQLTPSIGMDLDVDESRLTRFTVQPESYKGIPYRTLSAKEWDKGLQLVKDHNGRAGFDLAAFITKGRTELRKKPNQMNVTEMRVRTYADALQETVEAIFSHAGYEPPDAVLHLSNTYTEPDVVPLAKAAAQVPEPKIQDTTQEDPISPENGQNKKVEYTEKPIDIVEAREKILGLVGDILRKERVTIGPVEGLDALPNIKNGIITIRGNQVYQPKNMKVKVLELDSILGGEVAAPPIAISYLGGRGIVYEFQGSFDSLAHSRILGVPKAKDGLEQWTLEELQDPEFYRTEVLPRVIQRAIHNKNIDPNLAKQVVVSKSSVEARMVEVVDARAQQYFGSEQLEFVRYDFAVQFLGGESKPTLGQIQSNEFPPQITASYSNGTLDLDARPSKIKGIAHIEAFSESGFEVQDMREASEFSSNAVSRLRQDYLSKEHVTRKMFDQLFKDSAIEMAMEIEHAKQVEVKGLLIGHMLTDNEPVVSVPDVGNVRLAVSYLV